MCGSCTSALSLRCRNVDRKLSGAVEHACVPTSTLHMLSTHGTTRLLEPGASAVMTAPTWAQSWPPAAGIRDGACRARMCTGVDTRPTVRHVVCAARVVRVWERAWLPGTRVRVAQSGTISHPSCLGLWCGRASVRARRKRSSTEQTQEGFAGVKSSPHIRGQGQSYRQQTQEGFAGVQHDRGDHTPARMTYRSTQSGSLPVSVRAASLVAQPLTS
eukprot:351628-Chlamydomonas_euryale.AAC.10